MSRDLRDPQKLGERYLEVREAGLPIEIAVEIPARHYTDGGAMSAPPEQHHLADHPDVHKLASTEDMST